MTKILQYVKVKRKTLDELKQQFGVKEDPEDEARSQEVLRWMLEVRPKVKEELIELGVEKGALRTAREALWSVLEQRGLMLEPEQVARIEQCNDRVTLMRWLNQAITAGSAAEALR